MSAVMDDADSEPNQTLCDHVDCKELANKKATVQISDGLFVTLHYCPIHSWQWD